jgi:thioester reductase-like protein
MNEFDRRIDKLSPEQRKLLLTRLQKETVLDGKKAKKPDLPHLDLSSEAILDPAISPQAFSLESQGEPKSILLTGGTGFLGAFLILELLENTRAEIYCLVRASDLEAGRIRLQNNFKRYKLKHKQFNSRIIPILGDLSQPHLGLSPENYDNLAKQIDTIYHNGALLNYFFPYPAFKKINVWGTQEILRLACQTKVKPVHYVSSIAVLESSTYAGKVVTEEEIPQEHNDIYLGYSQSKWVAERLVLTARDRGLPVSIYRPSFIGGHSKTGVVNTEDFICRIFKGYIQMGSIPNLDYLVDASPVDYVSRAIVYLSQKTESIGKTFHLQHPQPISWQEHIKLLSFMGYALPVVPLQQWQEKLQTTVSSEDHPLYTLQPFLFKRYSEEQLTIMELYMRSRRPKIDSELTLTALANSGIVCPLLDSSYYQKCFAYYIKSGFLSVKDLFGSITKLRAVKV